MPRKFGKVKEEMVPSRRSGRLRGETPQQEDPQTTLLNKVKKKKSINVSEMTTQDTEKAEVDTHKENEPRKEQDKCPFQIMRFFRASGNLEDQSTHNVHLNGTGRGDRTDFTNRLLGTSGSAKKRRIVVESPWSPMKDNTVIKSYFSTPTTDDNNAANGMLTESQPL